MQLRQSMGYLYQRVSKLPAKPGSHQNILTKIGKGNILLIKGNILPFYVRKQNGVDV